MQWASFASLAFAQQQFIVFHVYLAGFGLTFGLTRKLRLTQIIVQKELASQRSGELKRQDPVNSCIANIGSSPMH